MKIVDNTLEKALTLPRIFTIIKKLIKINNKNDMKKLVSSLKQKKNWSTLLIALAVLVVLGFITTMSLRKDEPKKSEVKPGKTLNVEEASAKAEEFINTFLMSSGSTAKVKEVVSEYGMYKLSIDITSDVVESYLTKDGKLFFPQALNIDEITAESQAPAAGTAPVSATVSNKTAKPVIELFVMSHCPFGTQMEKGILPVVDLLGDKIDFEIKFNNYAMHGEKELVEQLNQYCIQKEQADKYSDYLSCFLGAGDSEACRKEANINQKSLDACYAKTDKEFKVMENFKNNVGYQGSYPGFDIYAADNTKYGVGGSPTLVINGETIQSGRDSASLLTTICSAFTESPEECSSTLSSASPSAGFGYGTAAAGTDASCE